MGRCRTIIIAAFLASSTAVRAAESDIPAAPSFENVATSSIKQVLRELGYNVEMVKTTPPLVLGQIIETRRGSESLQTIELKCGSMGAWRVGEERDEAYLVAGLCDLRSELTPEILATATQTQNRMIEMLLKGTPKGNVSMLAEVEPKPVPLGTSLEGEYRGIILGGHGLWVLPTLIARAADGRRAIVVQSHTSSCEVRPTSPLCSGQEEWLQRIALKVAEGLRFN